MFQYKPLEKSAKKEKDYTGQGLLRMKLRMFDPILVPIESGYEKIRKIPVLGWIVGANVKLFTTVVVIALICAGVILLVAAGAILAVQLQEWAPTPRGG